MPRGREYRTRHFKNRALSFWSAARAGKLTTTVLRDGKEVSIGKKSVRGIIRKPNAFHYSMTKNFVERLFQFIEQRHVELKHIRLARVNNFFAEGKSYSDDAWLQEYFPRPTLEAAEKYFDPHRSKQLSRDEGLICKRFFRQPINRKITRETIENAVQEWKKLMTQAQIQPNGKSNAILLGRNRDGTLRVAAVDV